jgi:membrane protein YdbS with pleckstrin-like domain
MRRIIVKEGPMVFLRDVLVMELFAAGAMYGLSFLENYEQLFQSWGIGRYVRYDIFLILVFSLFQLGYVTLLFLHWYFSHFEIRDKEITRKSGLLFRRRKSVSLLDVVSVETYQSPIGRLMYHATIILEHRGGRVTKIKNVGNFQEYVHILQHLIGGPTGLQQDPDVAALIEHGESRQLEFKETLRYDVRKGETSREMEHAALKGIVGFMNADGGTLLIGVNDHGEIKGLENDYKALPKKNRDGFENHLSMLVKTMIGLPYAKYISVRFEKIDNKDVCIVKVHESHKPAYLHNGERREEFFVRVGNSTQPFTMSEAEEYIKTNWK